jgi:hypothetical protein
MSLDAIARRGRMVAIHPTSIKDVVVLSPEKRDRVGVKTGYGSSVLRLVTKTFPSWKKTLCLPF